MEEKIKRLLKELRLNESLISTVLGVAVVLLIGVLMYRYFSQKPTSELSGENLKPEEITEQVEFKPGEAPVGLPTTHKVEKGEHLWSISQKYYGSGYNWVDIASANNIKNGNLIEVGQELTIPNVAAKQQTVSASTQKVDQVLKGSTVTVQKGDSLWSIAVRVYADGYQWPKIYQANKEKIGINPNLIEKGMELVIPGK